MASKDSGLLLWPTGYVHLFVTMTSGRPSRCQPYNPADPAVLEDSGGLMPHRWIFACLVVGCFRTKSHSLVGPAIIAPHIRLETQINMPGISHHPLRQSAPRIKLREFSLGFPKHKQFATQGMVNACILRC